MRKDDLDRIEKWAATSLRTALALLLTLTLCGPAAAIGFNANGAFATAVNCFSQTSLTECISVEVDTGSANGQKTTFLFYDHLSVIRTLGFYYRIPSVSVQSPTAHFRYTVRPIRSMSTQASFPPMSSSRSSALSTRSRAYQRATRFWEEL